MLAGGGLLNRGVLRRYGWSTSEAFVTAAAARAAADDDDSDESDSGDDDDVSDGDESCDDELDDERAEMIEALRRQEHMLASAGVVAFDPTRESVDDAMSMEDGEGD